MKILNLYAGIGGNRKLWGDEHKITAVEYDPKIAAIYKDFFPSDNVIVEDAHKYLIEHMNEYDFIWSSPPCPTHSTARCMGVQSGNCDPKYPDMTLYQEIIILRNFYKKEGLYCVENVNPYYEPLITPQKRDRHCFWANFFIHEYNEERTLKHNKPIDIQEKLTGYNLSKYKDVDKKRMLNNCVDSKLGLHILESAIKNKQQGLFL